MKKFTWISVLTLAATLFTTAAAHATDAALIVAALPTEKAVCRYVAQMMEKRRQTTKEMHALTATADTPQTQAERLKWIMTSGALLERNAREAAASNEVSMVVDAKYPHLVCPF